MKILFINEQLVFNVIPREYPLITDTIVLELKNEISGLVLTPAISFLIGQKLQITIISQPTDFKPKNKYEITIKKDENVLYLGKLMTVDSGTDVQNYQQSSQTNGKYKYKE
jgi:hypothetical protein